MIKFYSWVAIASLLLPASLIAQQKVTARPVNQKSLPSLSNIFKKYALFEINTVAVQQYVQQAAARGANFNLELDLPGYASLPLQLHQHDILTNNYKLIVNGAQGRQEFAKPACITYQGELANQSNSHTALTITSDLIFGNVTSTAKSYFIEPARYLSQGMGDNVYVVYESKDVVPNSAISCGVTEVATRRVTSNNARGTATGACRMYEVAIASDNTMSGRYRSATGVQNHNIAVMNTMVGMYSNTQLTGQYLEFKIVGQYISQTYSNNALSPLYAGNDANTLLDNFRVWGNSGGFGFTYDLGVYWTAIDIAAGGSNGVIGLAYLGATCSDYRYQILEDLQGLSGDQLGALAAHETGHNFNADHDGSGDPYIMAPSVGNPPATTFSTASLGYFNAFMASGDGNCYSACNAVNPVAQFNVSVPSACIGNSITFTDYSVGDVSNVSWTFQDGTPATSTDAAPSVTFATPGLKNVTLTATNASGTNSITKTVFIGSPLANGTCRANTTAHNGEFGAIYRLMLENLNWTAPNPVPLGYDNYVNVNCGGVTMLEANTTYTGLAGIGLPFSPPYDYAGKLQLFIDYNNDGDFNDANESIYNSTCLDGYMPFTFSTPATTPVMDTYLRMRLVAIPCGQANTNGCVVPIGSAVNDYAVYFTSAIALPVLLKSFDGYYSNGKNELSWISETEVNTAHYIVERSIDGNQYVEAGRVAAKGLTNTLANHYQLTDGLMTAENVNRFYYRLKIVDKDGSFKYSKLVITTRATGDAVQVIVYPNPVLRNTTLQIKKANNNKSLIEVYNSMGQRVYTKQQTMALYNVAIEVPAHWTPGIYMVRVTDGKENWSRSVIIK